ncbi:MAG: SxtJ family membrane protein [Proteobacteria bacterium]|nr:SxtJ family membrane protein [Pseudomonadota bacterium]
MSTHERFQPLHTVKTSSDRAFGLVFAGVFSIAGAISMLGERGRATLWFLLAGALFLLAALLAPAVLAPLNRIWTRFGLLLHAIVSPIVLGSIFFLVVMPIGLTMRLFGKNPLPLRFDHGAKSYWIKREPHGPDSGGFRDQF